MNDYINIPLGAIESPPDNRDKHIEDLGVMMSEAPLPEEYTIPYLPEIYSQGRFGMCVAFSLASIKESQELKERKVRTRFSPGFIYGNRAENDFKSEGMMPREAIKQLHRFGTCKFDDLPIINNYPTCRSEIDKKVEYFVANSMPQKIHTYASLRNVEEIKKFLYTFETPVLVSMTIYDSFYQTGSDGIVKPNSGNSRGGHAMIAVGWKKINGVERIIIANSWNTTWGDKGYCYVDPTTAPIRERWGIVDYTMGQELSKARELLFIIGRDTMTVNGKRVSIPQSPIVFNGKTMVPVRELCEALNMKVDWYPSSTPGSDGSMILIRDGGEMKNLNELNT